MDTILFLKVIVHFDSPMRHRTLHMGRLYNHSEAHPG
jgi:hypothetical protein